jgi:hypothetical protein
LVGIHARIVGANDAGFDTEFQQAAVALVEQLLAMREEQTAVAAGEGGLYSSGRDRGLARARGRDQQDFLLACANSGAAFVQRPHLIFPERRSVLHSGHTAASGMPLFRPMSFAGIAWPPPDPLKITFAEPRPIRVCNTCRRPF